MTLGVTTRACISVGGEGPLPAVGAAAVPGGTAARSRGGTAFGGLVRDVAVLEALCRWGAMTAEQLRVRYFAAAQVTVRNRLRLLAQRGLVRVVRPRWHGAAAYVVTPAGARFCGSELPAPRVSSGVCLGHTLTLVDASWWLLGRAPAGSSWALTDREAQRLARRAGRVAPAPGRWSEALETLRRGEHAVLPTSTTTHPAAAPAVPDGVLRLPGGERVAVEATTSRLSRAAVARTEAKLAWYASPEGRAAYAGGVRWVVARSLPDVARRLQQRAARLDGAHIKVELLPPHLPDHRCWG